MVSVYVKALVITLVLFVGNFFLVKYLDDSRAEQLSSEVAAIEENVQSANALILYSEVFNGSAQVCPMLAEQTQKQEAQLYQLFGDLQKSAQENVFTDTSAAKRRFTIANVQLWLYLQQLQKSCGSSNETPILYFYNDVGDCVECRAQAQVLSQVVAECPRVRVFALPYDSKMEVVNVLVSEFGVDYVPSLVIGNQQYKGLQTSEKVRGLTGCTG